MKKIILFIFLLLIAYSLCQNDDEYTENDEYDECEGSKDRSNCQKININRDGWSCYPVMDESDPELYCTTFPDFFLVIKSYFIKFKMVFKKSLILLILILLMKKIKMDRI